jgi:hypothetical protein
MWGAPTQAVRAHPWLLAAADAGRWQRGKGSGRRPCRYSLMSAMLTYDPDKRISIGDALDHRCGHWLFRA